MRTELATLSAQADGYFDAAHEHFTSTHDGVFNFYSASEDYWSQLPQNLHNRAEDLIAEVVRFAGRLAEASRHSALTSSEDTKEVRLCAKTMRAAVRLRRFYYNDGEVVHDEGAVLGYKPASQSEGEPANPREAKAIFDSCARMLSESVRLVESSKFEADNNGSTGDLVSRTSSHKIRPGTAFVMMWMDPGQPELFDVVDAVKTIFQRFEVKAVRADDIEHDGLISERVLNEIRTAEFLFADLTGARPNVYYEVGFAHALNRRVILFRRSGTGLHFDLAGYNCPEYTNLRDLKDKLTKRLVEVTSKSPRDPTEI